MLDFLTLFRGIYYILNRFVFRSVQKSKVPPYLKYLLLRDKGWCLQAGHTLDSTSKTFAGQLSPLLKDFCTELFGVGIDQK